MRVLTFGWDFPPQTTGGLGIACYGLTREISNFGVDVIFVLPRSQRVIGNTRFVFADTERNIKIREIFSELVPYGSPSMIFDIYDSEGKNIIHSRTMLEEIYRYAHRAAGIAQQEQFDVIHAHDWTAYLAGVAAKYASGKPLILHVHATSFDQAASDNVDPEVFKIEREAFAAADTVVAISHFVKNTLVNKHGVPADKIEVVHNGNDTEEPIRHEPTLRELKQQGKKIVLYHGRITVQKGVDYFVRAARRVIDVEPNVIFVISGSGDMTGQVLEQVAALGLSTHFIFAGALWYEDRDRMYQSADLVVMPSVSEPFGLVPLEALHHGTPSLISKQSGVSEVVKHVLKVDFWDVDEMANQIIAALRYPALHGQLLREGRGELQGLSWRKAADKIVHIYNRLVQWAH